MTATAQKLELPEQPMTVEEFLAWRGDGSGRVWELVDGVPRAQDHTSDAHGTVDTNLIAAISMHLRAHRPGCRVVSKPGIRPHLAATWNHRVPELAVTCAPNEAGMRATPAPVLLVEVLSPSNRADTWSNVPLYASVPSVQEILLVESEEVGAWLLRRGADGHWPRDPERVGVGGVIHLASIGFDLPMGEVYYATHLEAAARGGADGKG